MSTTMLNVRIDETLKRRGDAVLREAGVSTSAAIRAFYQHIASTGALPDYMAHGSTNAERVRRIQAAKRIAALGTSPLSELGDAEFDKAVADLLDQRYA